MDPEVVFLILCDDVREDPENYHRIDVTGLLISLRARPETEFPLVHPVFRALLIMTGGRGSGELFLRVVSERTGETIFQTRSRRVRFVGATEGVHGSRFNLIRCSFPEPGLYWVECVYSGTILARQRLRIIAGDDDE